MSILIQNGVLVLPDGPQRADLRVDGCLLYTSDAADE